MRKEAHHAASNNTRRPHHFILSADGKRKQLLSVRPNRAVRAWRSLRTSPEWHGCSFGVVVWTPEDE